MYEIKDKENITNDVDVKFRIKDINAYINQNKIIANALLDKIKIEHQIIAKPILFRSEVTLGQNIEIMIKTDSCDININDIFVINSKIWNPQSYIAS